MAYHRRCQLTLMALTLLMNGCAPSDKPTTTDAGKPAVPEYIQELDGLTIYSTDAQPADTVEFMKAGIFESNEEVFIKGDTREVAVDEQDRVFIAAGNMSEGGIYVFQPDGSYLTTIGQRGKGPGEFLSISSMSIQDDQLFVFDPVQQRFSVFSISDFSLVREALIKRDEVRKTDTLAYILRGNKLLTAGDGHLLLSLRNITPTREKDVSKILYYRLSEDGRMTPGRILELERFQFYFPETERDSKGYFRMPRLMPFSRSSLVTVSDDGLIYTAWTEEFLIKVHDLHGVYQRAFYYPYEKSRLSISDTELGEAEMSLLRENRSKIPGTWPALYTMEIDDQNRLWVFTITDNKMSYKGWVLNPKGELLAKFDWLGDRSSGHIMSKPLMVVKNGYLYTRERDIRAGIDRIIKHRILFKHK